MDKGFISMLINLIYIMFYMMLVCVAIGLPIVVILMAVITSVKYLWILTVEVVIVLAASLMDKKVIDWRGTPWEK